MKLTVDYTYRADGYNNPDFFPKPVGIMVHSTATPGVMAQQFRDSWDRPGVGASVHAFVDDKEVVQCLPWTRRAGHSGGTANKTHIAFEMCEPAGFKYNGGSNMVGYDVEKQKPYFAAVWQNAVDLCVYLCRMFGFDPLEDGVLICHSEGYTRGIASGHADVMHWFPKHGESMDSFRKAVATKLSMEDVDDMDADKFLEMYKQAQDKLDPYYAEIKDVPQYWQKEVERLVAVGAIKGDGTNGIAMRRSELKPLISAARYVDDYFGNPE